MDIDIIFKIAGIGIAIAVLNQVLAVAYITDLTAQLCRDAGESAVGGKVELAGKVIIFYLALPILSAILELIGTLLQ